MAAHNHGVQSHGKWSRSLRAVWTCLAGWSTTREWPDQVLETDAGRSNLVVVRGLRPRRVLRLCKTLAAVPAGGFGPPTQRSSARGCGGFWWLPIQPYRRTRWYRDKWFPVPVPNCDFHARWHWPVLAGFQWIEGQYVVVSLPDRSYVAWQLKTARYHRWYGYLASQDAQKPGATAHFRSCA